VAVAVVIGLPAVGVVLMAALLIVPSAAARFWTDRLGRLLMLSALFGLLIGVIGTMLSASFMLMPAGPIIVLVGSVVFLLSVLLGSRRGLISRALRHHRFRRELRIRRLLRIGVERALEQPAEARALAPETWLGRTSWTPGELARALAEAKRDGLVRATTADRYELTPAGWRQAIEAARGYRLWQSLLTEYPELAGSVANLGYAPIDQVVSAAIVDDLTRRLQASGHWPEIPAAAMGIVG
jgi:manganese/zinc/iron transport system permease protein